MKISQKIKLIIIASFLVVGCGNVDTAENKEQVNITEVAPENLLVVDYAIDGMVCAMGCANTIQEEVSGMVGIAECNVSFEDGNAHIEFDKSKIAEKEIIAKIETIAEGQYKVGEKEEIKEVTNDENTANEEEGNSVNEESITEVSLPSFEIPNLFTLLLDRI